MINDIAFSNLILSEAPRVHYSFYLFLQHRVNNIELLLLHFSISATAYKIYYKLIYKVLYDKSKYIYVLPRVLQKRI